MAYYKDRTDTKNYTLSDIKKEIKEDVELISKLGYNDVDNNKYIPVINTKMTKTLGRCTEYHGREGSEYTIEINNNYLRTADSENVHATIMHEVIHSVDGCLNHGPKWKSIAKEVSKAYGFKNIERITYDNEYAKILEKGFRHYVKCPNCGKIWKFSKKDKRVKAVINHHAHCGICGSKNLIYEYV